MGGYQSSTRGNEYKICFISVGHFKPKLIFDKSLINNETLRYIIDYIRNHYTRMFKFYTEAYASHPLQGHLAMIGIWVNSFKVCLAIDTEDLITQDKDTLLSLLIDERYKGPFTCVEDFDVYMEAKTDQLIVYDKDVYLYFDEKPCLRTIKALIDVLSETKSLEMIKGVKLADFLVTAI